MVNPNPMLDRFTRGAMVLLVGLDSIPMVLVALQILLLKREIRIDERNQKTGENIKKKIIN